MVKEIIISLSALILSTESDTVSSTKAENIKNKEISQISTPFVRFSQDNRYHILPSDWQKVSNKPN